MGRSGLDRAIEIVDRLGIALVYPIDNKLEPRSLWSELHSNEKMEWSWDEDADPRVAELWHLRERLARSHDVVYAKWFRGRATFFALPVFQALLGRIAAAGDVHAGLPREARDILELLRERSPLSTKEIRAQANLRGKEQETLFTHAMKVLWSRLLVVGIGEVEDGAFPSLAVGATELLFEDIWSARHKVAPEANRRLDAALAKTPAYGRELRRALDDLSGKPQAAPRARVPRRLRDLRERVPRESRGRAPRDASTPPFTEPSAADVFAESDDAGRQLRIRGGR